MWEFPPKRISIFRVNYILNNSDIKNLIFLFLFYSLSFDVLEKRKKIGGHQTNYFSEGPNLTHPLHIPSIIQYETLKSAHFAIYMIPYYLYEVILHYKAIKENEKMQ